MGLQGWSFPRHSCITQGQLQKIPAEPHTKPVGLSQERLILPLDRGANIFSRARPETSLRVTRGRRQHPLTLIRYAAKDRLSPPASLPNSHLTVNLDPFMIAPNVHSNPTRTASAQFHRVYLLPILPTSRALSGRSSLKSQPNPFKGTRAERAVRLYDVSARGVDSNFQEMSKRPALFAPPLILVCDVEEVEPLIQNGRPNFAGPIMPVGDPPANRFFRSKKRQGGLPTILHTPDRELLPPKWILLPFVKTCWARGRRLKPWQPTPRPLGGDLLGSFPNNHA